MGERHDREARRSDDLDGRRDNVRCRDRNRRGRYNNEHLATDHSRGWRRDNDDDNCNDFGHDATCGHDGEWGPDATFRHERTPSPRSRDRSNMGRHEGRHHQGGGCEDKKDGDDDRNNGSAPPTSPFLGCSSSPTELATAPMQFCVATPRLLPLCPRRGDLEGNEAWSTGVASVTTPVAWVFARINEALAVGAAEATL
uniref:Uncharacterized protein n=1 Tax=Oryza punctata TaxID=4537 RepID=A0A0E0L4E5_ORYPU